MGKPARTTRFRWPALGLLLLGCALAAPAQDETASIVDNDTSPYHQALLNYKSGHYDAARTAIDAAEKANPGDLPTEILKAKILTEQHDFAGGEKLLRKLWKPDGPVELDLALGDLLLAKRDFDGAAKCYAQALQKNAGDPDITLKMVYTQVSIGDLVDAEKWASQLKPFEPGQDPLDPKHPGNPSYYFAKAALAQATGKAQEAEDDIQTVRTLYGITIANHYLKTFFAVFAAAPSAAARAEPPDTNAAPTSPAQ